MKKHNRAMPNKLNGAITKVYHVVCPDNRRRVFYLSTPISIKQFEDLDGVNGRVGANGLSVSGKLRMLHPTDVGHDYDFIPHKHAVNADYAFTS